MIKLGTTLILNADTEEDTAALPDSARLCAITCGLSYKATVTASSIDEAGFTYCIQRSIFTLNHTKLAPQEFPIRWHRKPEDIYPCLELVTALLLCDTPIETFAACIL